MISVIIPTYNEAKNLPELMIRLNETLDHSSLEDEYEIVVVDDDSPDGTASIAETYYPLYPVRVVRRVGVRDLAGAVVEGFWAAKGDVFVVMDGDLQHPPEIVMRLLNVIDGADIVIAARRDNSKFSVDRSIISFGATWLAYMLFPKLIGIRDPMSGFFAVKRDVVKGVRFDPVGYKILLEVLVRGKYRRVYEVPYEMDERCGGGSKMGWRVVVDYLRHLWRLSIM